MNSRVEPEVISSGELRPNLDPERAAVLLTVIFRGIGLQALNPSRSSDGDLTKDTGGLPERWLKP